MEGAGRNITPFGAFLRDVGDELAGAPRPAPSQPSSGREHWRRLSKEAPPIAGESLRGLVARACQTNHLPNSWGLLQHLGQRHRPRVNVSEDENVNPAELAFAMRVQEQEVSMRRYPDLGKQHLSFYGLDVHSDTIDKRVRWFSPTLLRTKQHHLAMWELSDVPFCLQGWDMLQNTCWCEKNGIVQKWVRTQTAVDLCDQCGDPLRWLDAFHVPGNMRAALSIIEPLVDPSPERRAASLNRLPAGLRHRDRSAVFYLLTRMARAFDPDAMNRSNEMPTERLEGLHRACLALSHWPKGLSEQRWDERTTDGAARIIRSLWGRLEHSFAAPQSVVAARQPASLTLAHTNLVRDYVGVRRAIEITQLSRGVLLAIWESGLVPRHQRTHGSANLPAFDPDEIESIGNQWRGRLELKSIGNRFGMPAYGVEQLLALGVMTADGIAIPGTGPFFSEGADERTVVRAEEACTRWRQRRGELDRPVPLRKALLQIGGRSKPWGPILRAMLGDADAPATLPFDLGDGVRLADRLLVDERDVPIIRSMTFDRAHHRHFAFNDRMVQRDALELLNTDAHGISLLDGLMVEGSNPMTYLAREVENRATEVVTLREIAARLGVDAGDAEKRMAAIPPISAKRRNLVWHRTVLLDL